MRLGVLVNLAVILAVSGALLFIVFSASLRRAVLEDRLRQAAVLGEMLEHQMMSFKSPTEMWAWIRLTCTSASEMGLLLYDSHGKIAGGCSKRADLPKPELFAEGTTIQVARRGLPGSLFRGISVVVDVKGEFLQDIKMVRGILEVPPSVFTAASRFVAAYLVLTQLALFFMGYVLFHRTVIGPIRETARIAGNASGITSVDDVSSRLRWKGDIQRIASSLRAMIMKIVEDREKMQDLVNELRQSHRELEAAQQGLIRSEKMASVGRLASGLAHEVGNPLQILMGYVELLPRETDPDSRSDILRRMDEELKRIHSILQRLLEFARPIREHVQVCDINRLVEDVASLVKGRKGFRKLDFHMMTDPSLEPTPTESEKIRQVLINLIFNAADAIPESGGRISLRTRKTSENIEIQVEDTGSGIPQEDLEKVFDPFFTTKEPGKGTGLGLAVCLGLIESMGGTIDFLSEIGRGTTVTVTVPIQDEERAQC